VAKTWQQGSTHMLILMRVILEIEIQHDVNGKTSQKRKKSGLVISGTCDLGLETSFEQ